MWRALITLIKIAIYLAIILIGLLLFSAAFRQHSTPGILIGVFLCLLGFVGFIALFWGRRWWGTVAFVISLLIVAFGCGVFLLVPRPMAHAPVELEPSPPAEGPVVLKKIETTATSAANEAVAEYRKPEHAMNKARAVASLSSVSNQLRTLQNTRVAAEPNAIREAVKMGSVSESVTAKVAPEVAVAIGEAVKAGVSPDAANEAAARGLDKAATAPSEVDKLLDELPWANIAFNPPGSLGYGKKYTLHLELSAKKTGAELAASIPGPGERETAAVQISKEMQARLTGDGFQITAVGSEKQAVSATATHWSWEVTPKQMGQQLLHLTLEAVVKVGDHETTHVLKTFDKTIGVNVVWPETPISFLGKYWQWVCTAVVFPVVAWLAKKFFKG